MERLSIDEIIEHCKRKTKIYEKSVGIEYLETTQLTDSIKEYWEHRQVRDYLEKLKEYEDLEDRLNGISVKQVVHGFIKTVENQTCEGYEHGRILTNAEADKWNEYKQLEEQGLLLRLPCKVGDTVYYISEGFIEPCTVEVIFISDYTDKDGNSSYMAEIHYDRENCPYVSTEIYFTDIGKTVFLTKSEAEQKLREMEGGNNVWRTVRG